ncbi:MAG: DEAD/DEAH box helicase, partial [Candidatus Eisenbacteria bacterium]|nr:DEAD/DEAH box helicase [Candidatus Eisenbacteria bacterium]
MKTKKTRGTRRSAGRTGRASAGDGTSDQRLSRMRCPEGWSLEAWQIALRRQYGLGQSFRVRNLGAEPVFSEFEVTNPETRRSYRVAIRGEALGENFCSCPDFTVNTLGTCKHIEFLLGRLRRGRATRAALAAGFRQKYSEIYLHYGPRREIRFKPGTECPEAFRRIARKHFDGAGSLKPSALAVFPALLRAASRAGHEIRCYDDALEFVARARDRVALARRIDRLLPRGAAAPLWDDLLKARLYPYQREGALFAARAGRCLIADDMGLGKTLQALAAAEILARLGAVERVLIVSPTSLKHQWKKEIERFTDRPALVVEGLLAERTRRYAADAFYKITNYDVVHRDLEQIDRWRPDLVILDEAQRIKNWRTRAARSVKRIASDHAFVLTGTPLENRLEELLSIVEFVDRYRLGPMFRFLSEHQHLDENGRVVGYRRLSTIARTLQPILVRRTKQTVLRELPERLEKRFFVAMTEEQRRHHEENREIVARIAAKWRRYKFLSDADQRRLLIALQNMRMSCNSTYLLDQTTDHGVKADEATVLLEEILEDPQAKVVVFSQWLRTHELLERRIRERAWDHVLFHGGVPGRARGRLVDRFREDPACRLFLSTDAGGVGLNLQHASVVVIMDQPWNPAVLDQRIGRVHRLGQRQPVRVVHFIAQGTIEEGMLSLLAFKKSLFAGVLDGGQDEVFLGGTRLTQFMESVERVTGAIPEAMPAADEDGAREAGAREDGAREAEAREAEGRDDGAREAGAREAGARDDGAREEGEAADAADSAGEAREPREEIGAEAWGEVLAAGAA